MGKGTKAIIDLYDPYTGDELWSLYVARYGTTPLFTEPGQLRAVFDIYVQWCRNHPIEVLEYVKSGINAGSSYIKKMKLYVSEFGFTQFIGADGSYLEERLKTYTEMQERYHDNESAAFLKEIEAIRKWIRDDLDKSAMVGQFDAGYVAKIRGLREQRDVTSGGEKIQGAMKIEVLSNEAVGNLHKLRTVQSKRKAKDIEKLADNKEHEKTKE